MNLYAYGYLLSFLLNTSLGVFILVRNPRCQANRVFFVMGILVAFFAFSQFEFVKSESVESAMFWYRAGSLWPLVLPLLLHFTAVYPRPPQTRLSLWLDAAIYTPAALLVLALYISPPSALSTPVRLGDHWVVQLAETSSMVSMLVIVLSTLYTLLIAAWNVVHLVRAPTQIERRQRLVVLIGVLIGLVASAASYALMPAMGLQTPDIATYGFGFGCVILGFAVWKYKLFTLDVVAAAEQIVRDMPSALILLGPNNEMVRINEAGHQLLGLADADPPDASFLERIAEGSRPSVEHALEESAEHPGTSIDTEILGVNQESIPVSLVFSPVTDAKGRPVGTVCLGRDLSPEVQAETEKHELEDRLRQSEKMEAIGRLAGGVAHDFNNILAGILGYADLIRGKLDEGDIKLNEYVENIVTGSKRAARLVANLLTFARKRQLNLEPVDIHKTTTQVAELLAHSIDKRIDVSLSLDAGSPCVLADAAQLHNAILNLAINARDAMGGNGTIGISTRQQELDSSEIARHNLGIQPGAYVLLSVRDTGAGISSESIGRIFDPFFTTKEVGQGTGLGLASVYGTAHACNGTVTVQSREGQGSTFTMYLQSAAPGDDTAEAEESAVRSGKANILVIDDEKLVRDVTRFTLESLGYAVHSCGDGVEGSDLVRKNPGLIDLVILDLNMPGHSGYEIIDTLKELEPGLPVVISTGLLSIGDDATSVHEQASGFLQKPFRRAELASTIEEVLQSHHNS